MSSEGTGAPISVQDANDLLHKFSTESTRMQALLTGAVAGIRAAVVGVVRGAQDNTVWVVQDPDVVGSPFIGFDPAASVLRKYGDERAMLNKGEHPSGFRFRSILTFAFKDGSTVSVFETAESDETDG
jgi:hypothetical protein